MFLYILSWLSTLIHVVFITLSLAAGLFYLAEVVEEYTVMTAKVIKWLIVITTGVFIGLFLFERMPIYLTGLGVFSNIIYYVLLNDFPYISLTSPAFLISCGFVFVNHYLAFQYFAYVYYAFTEVLAYFTICLWLVPFAFFISLSVNEYVLPTMKTTEPVIGLHSDNLITGKKSKRSGLLSMFDYFKTKKDDLLPRSKRY